MFPYNGAIIVHSQNEKEVSVFPYKDVWSCGLKAALCTVILYKYLIVQMLCVYYVDGVVVAEAWEQWKKQQGGKQQRLLDCMEVRVLASDLTVNFDPVMMQSCREMPYVRK